MGGITSGNHKADAKLTTGRLPDIDVRTLARKGLLSDELRSGTITWSTTQGQRAEIQIRANRKRVDFWHTWNDSARHEQADIEHTPCHYGGTRAWFVCPDCGRRVAILYKHQYIACRQCHRLAYASQNETDCDQAARQAAQIRTRLGWKPGILNGEGCKPKQMQWRTYHRLVERHRYYWRQFMHHIPYFGSTFR